MQTSFPTMGTISQGRRLIRSTAVLGLLLVFGIVQIGLAQTGTNQFNLFNNYFVTGDYVVAAGCEGSPDGRATRRYINVPDLRTVPERSACDCAGRSRHCCGLSLLGDCRASQSGFAGQQGFFNGYAITGTVLETPMPPLPGVPAGVRAHLTGQRRCGPTAQMSARTFPWTRIPRPQHLERSSSRAVSPCDWRIVEAMAIPPLMPWGRPL